MTESIETKYDDRINRALRILFYGTAILTLLTLLLDSIAQPGSISNRFYINPLSFIIVAASLLLVALGWIRFSKGFFIVVVVIFYNCIITFYKTIGEPNFTDYFLRDSVFLGLIITMSAYVVSKKHALMFSGIYILFYISLMVVTGDSILRENSFIMILTFLSYGIVLYYFVNIQEKALLDIKSFTFLVKEQNEEIQVQNEELMQSREEVRAQNDKLASQNALIEKKNKNIYDNLEFAQNIQKSILPKEGDFTRYLPDGLIIHKPKDAISGDFYWLREKKGKLFIAAIDCTGHGVSGALVSMIIYITLNRVLGEIQFPTPAQILNKLDAIILAEFNKDFTSFNTKIGMDIALISLDLENSQVEFSGAFNPLYLIRGDELIEYKANRYMIGMEVDEFFNHFNDQVIEVKPGDILYFFSDGMPDQFGGPLGKKFGYKRMRDLMLSIRENEMETQKEMILEKWAEWKGSHDQVDDIIILGIKL